jgi:preprotein translocase SecE subunit
VAQAKSSQSNPARAGSSREQARRGGSVGTGGRGSGRGTAVVSGGGAGAPPVMPSVGGRGRRTGNPFAQIVNFVRDVRAELRKVAWPTQRETINLTVVVIALSVAMGIFLGGVDFIFQELFRFLIQATGGSA